MRILKICCNEWLNASRDKREMSVCKEIGAEVIILAKGLPKDKGRLETVDGFNLYRYTTKPLGRWVPDIINKLFALIFWANFVHKLSPDIISGHDIAALFIGWLSNLFTGKKAKLVYDSHEFELGRNTKRNMLQFIFIKQLERFLIKRCSFSIMVNKSIANEVAKIYSLKQKPLVIRNIPNKWIINKNKCELIRSDFVKKTNDCLLIYHGAITVNRGLESLIKEVSKIDKVVLLILGYSQNKEYLSYLKDITIKLNIENRVIFHPAVPIDILWEYVGAADICICPDIPNPPRSYYYMLPNKFFESIQAETPIISGKFPEIIQIINKYEIGEIYDIKQTNSLEEAITKIFYNKNNYKKYINNLKKAKNDLCWESEKIKLENAYKQIISQCK